MASIILSAAGSAVGSSTGLPFGSMLGARIGSVFGRALDGKFLGGTQKLRGSHGPRLADLGVQSSTYGKMIPIIYGTLRIGGNLIWSRPIKETATTSSSSASVGGKGGGGKVSQSSTSYSYSITMAVAVCEGPVDEVLRIWADARQLDMASYTIRIYKGDEEQLPDSLIQSFEGVDKTPGYRGLCYVVFEDFPLADFGNRIPNITFELRKKALYPDYEGQLLEDMITGVVMIPGAGEFVYDTHREYKIPGTQVGSGWVQQGEQQSINSHTPYGKANALVSLDQLAETCPNVEWISVVVSWFGNSMDAGDCIIRPGVEYQVGGMTAPDSWAVAGFTRSTARLITQIDGAPQYGGTPDDDSILRYLDELQSRGYKVAFYPMMFMDVSGKPWRGDLTGSPENVADFFIKTDGYNAFIMHYVNLVAGRVDAFIIGSELKGLTKVTSTPGVYPAVDELINLAADVKAVLGSSVTITYAADWSEYHHTDGGWYNLDALWASPDIDVIGIDAYFPLMDSAQSGYDVDSIMDGWTSGEGYDFYYSDPERTIQAPLGAAYAWKNLQWFWQNTHTNPGGDITPWVPESKKIWFTEYGFPSVDGAANQPNVFYDPTTSLSAFPYHSRGRIDFRSQRAAILATELMWQGSDMVEQKFVWAWDARPYPYWPDLLHVWADGAAWKTGHWVQGKLGISSLAAILADLCQRAGLQADDFDVSQISEQVEGFFISSQQSIRNAIETLQGGYFFDSVESDHVLKFIPRGGNVLLSVTKEDIIPHKGINSSELLTITRTQEIELPQRINIIYVNRLLNYQSSTQHSQRAITSSREIKTLDLPIVMPDQIAKNIADITLFTDWAERTSYVFSLPLKYVQLEPADIINIEGVSYRMRITSVQRQSRTSLRIQAVADDEAAYDFYTSPGESAGVQQEISNVPVTRLELLDLPALPGESADKPVIHVAGGGVAVGWTGAALYRSDDAGANYSRMADVITPAVIGAATNALASGPTTVFDMANTVTVIMAGSDSSLQSVTELAVLNGANAALLGDEIIQFTTATLVSPGQYTLGGLLRGRLGTEWAAGTHAAGDRFVLLDGRVTRLPVASNIIGLPRSYKAVSYGTLLSSAIAEDFTYSAIMLKPLSPVHIAAIRDGGGNITLSWIRRTRAGGDWQDHIDVPLNEVSEAYEVDILSGSMVLRTLSGLNAASASYSAAQQTTDFGIPQASVNIRIYQLSAWVGRGYAGAATV